MSDSTYQPSNGDPMPIAEELRTAADKLRKLASNATQGPWEATWRGQEYQLDGYRNGELHSVAEWTYAIVTSEPAASEQRAECDTVTADYIATMHPVVGLLLADWLDSVARRSEYNGADWVGADRKYALALTRVVNRTA